MGIGRILPGVATLSGRIYVVGGEQESQILANGEVYDPSEDTWTPVAPMVGELLYIKQIENLVLFMLETILF